MGFPTASHCLHHWNCIRFWAKWRIIGPCHLPKYWDKKPKATTKVTNEPPMKVQKVNWGRQHPQNLKLFSPYTNWKSFLNVLVIEITSQKLTSKSMEVKIDQLLDIDSLNVSKSSVQSTSVSLSIPRSVSDDAQGKSVSIEFAEISFRQEKQL